MNTNPNAAGRLIQSLDIADFEDVPDGTLVIKHPATGAPTTNTITLAGPEHDVRKKIGLDRTRKARAAFRKTGKVDLGDPLDDLEEETDYLVASTLGWAITLGGAPLPFSEAAARALYTDKKRAWLRAQVRAGLDQAELFIGNSAKP